MQQTNNEDLQSVCDTCHSLYDRNLIVSSGGNVSLRQGDKMYITRTGATLGTIQTSELVEVQVGDGTVTGEGKPSKELGFHLGMLRAHPEMHAVIHVHPTAVVAYSARYPTPGLFALPPTNAGFYVRAGQVPLLPYFHSGSEELHEAVTRLAVDFTVIALAIHGLIVARPTLQKALNVVEEIEQNCEIYLMASEDGHYLTPQQCVEIDTKLGRKWPDPAEYDIFFSKYGAPIRSQPSWLNRPLARDGRPALPANKN
jgi:L-fuculose-phosphate aldolase